MSSAKFFVECQKSDTRQRPSLPSAALGKELHSAKSSLPSAGHSTKKGTRQKRGTRHRLPRVTVFSHVLLCRVPKQALGKDFFFWKILCRVPLTRRSAKNFFSKCLCRVPLWRHSAKRKFLKKIKIHFAERLIFGTPQIPHLPSAMPRHSAKFVFSSKFFVQPFYSTRNS